MNKVILVSNMYPSEDNVAFGTFVRNTVTCLEKGGGTNVEVIALKPKKNSFLMLLEYIKLYLKSFLKLIFSDYDICYVHYTSHSSLGVILAKKLKKNIKIVSHVHGSDVLRESGVSKSKFYIKRIISNTVMKNSNLILVPSAYYENVIISNYPDIITPIRVSPSGGIDDNYFYANNLSKKGNGFTIGFVGRLTKDKGFLDYLELYKTLKENVRFKFIIVGDGPLKGQAEEIAVEANVMYSSKVEQKYLGEIYRKMDLFIFPTKRKTESLGLVAIEALSCSVPVIAYKVGGPEEYIVEDKNGYLVEIGDIPKLIERVIEYSNKPLLEQNILREQASLSASKYTQNNVAKEMKEHFEKVLINEW